MRGRVRVGGLLCGLWLACLVGCQKKAAGERVPGVGPYPECRSIVEWVRVQTNDPDAKVVRWGPREKRLEEKSPADEVPIVIEVHYQAANRDGDPENWTQKVRIIGPHIQQETAPVTDKP